MSSHGTRQLDSRWHQLEAWARRLYDELSPGDTLEGVCLAAHGPAGECLAYWADTSGTVNQTVIAPDGTLLTVPAVISTPPGGAG